MRSGSECRSNLRDEPGGECENGPRALGCDIAAGGGASIATATLIEGAFSTAYAAAVTTAE
jgi:hypothetical protein